MTEIALTLQRATPQNFSDFGAIITPSGREAELSGEEFNWWEKRAVIPLGEEAEVGLVEAKNTGSYEQKTLEQHRFTSEVLIPVDNDVFLVLGRPEAFSGTGPQAADVAAFCIPRGCIVALKEGVWHQGPMTLADRAGVFVVYRGKTGIQDKVVRNMADCGVHITVAEL